MVCWVPTAWAEIQTQDRGFNARCVDDYTMEVNSYDVPIIVRPDVIIRGELKEREEYEEEM